LEDHFPFNAELHNEMEIDTCVENFSGAVLKSYFLTPASEPKLTNTDEVLEASSLASGIPPRSDFQCGSPHPSLPYYVEARSSDFYPYTG
jgi:hypothetical protein